MFVIALVTALFFFIPGIYAETTYYVDDDAPEGGDGGEGTPFNTIQEAIDNASAGDTIRVFAGTYQENVLVNKTVSVIGNGSADTIINGSDSGHVVTISSDWANLSGCHLTASGSGFWDAGVRISADNVTVSNNNCSGNNYGILTVTQRDGRIHNNTCSGNARDGIMIYNSDFFDIRDNGCSGNRYGIALLYTESTLAEANDISNNERGVSCTNANDDTILKNTIHDNFNGVYISTSSNEFIQENDITYNEFGVNLSEADSQTINGNTIRNNTIGILFSDSDSNVLEENTITRNGQGFLLMDSSSSNRASGNTFENNTRFGINATDNSGQTVDARYNWWGDTSGPYHETMNSMGKGDNVTDRVQFDPWEGKAKSVYNVDKEEYYVTIDEALENASSGNTIRIFAGTFSGPIIIDMTLTIIGNGSGETIIDGQGNGNVITIQAPNVNISRCTIRGSESNRAGIRIQSDGNTLSDNTFTGNYHGMYLDSVHNNFVTGSTFNDNYNGILLQDCQNNHMEDNSFGTQQLHGIALYSSMDNSVGMNTFTGNHTAGIYLSGSTDNLIERNSQTDSSGWGISLLKSNDNIISNNNIESHAGSITLDQSENTIISLNEINNSTDEGIYLAESDSNTIHNNTCSGNKAGIFVGEGSEWNTLADNFCNNGTRGIYLKLADLNIMQDNSCLGNEYGIYVTRSDLIIIEGGTLGNGEHGLYFYDCSDILVQLITAASNNQSGVYLTEVNSFFLIHSIIESNTGAGFISDHSSSVAIDNSTISSNGIGLTCHFSTDVEAHGNNIMNNQEAGVDASSDQADVIDATYNYWGDPTGPYHPLDNSDGEGDEVTDNVDFTPWYGEYTIWSVIDWVYPTDVLQGETIHFSGHGISHFSVTSPISSYSWTSSLDGELFSGSNPDFSTASLSNGTHTIEFRIHDGSGVSSHPAISQVHVNGVPVVSLANLAPWALEGDDFVLTGIVDEDSSIARYRWFSSHEGLLYNGSNPTFNWRGLSRGHRIITFSVMDDRGVWSETSQADFTVYSQPVATIESINPDPAVQDNTIQFTGSGTADNEVVRYVWRSDKDGTLYDGDQSSFDLSPKILPPPFPPILYGLTNGTHTISLQVMDSVGIWSEEVSYVIKVNLRPRAVIRSITPNPAVPGDTIIFTANATDDGTVKRYSWTSDLDGELYNGSNQVFTSFHLSFGTHTITLSVLDDGINGGGGGGEDSGVWSLGTTTQIVITMKPTAFIDGISPSPAYLGDTIMFRGNGSDDGSIAQLRWISTIDGELITTTEFEIGFMTLSPGVHTIYLEVRDNDGIWSDPASAILEILDNRPPTVQLTSPVQDSEVEGLVIITGTSSDDNMVSRIEYQIDGASEWKSIQGDRESWTLEWDSTLVTNGSYLLVFRSFDGLLYSDTVTLDLTVKNEQQAPPGDTDSDDGLNVLLLLASFGLVIMILILIGLFHSRPSNGTSSSDTKGSGSEADKLGRSGEKVSSSLTPSSSPPHFSSGPSSISSAPSSSIFSSHSPPSRVPASAPSSSSSVHPPTSPTTPPLETPTTTTTPTATPPPTDASTTPHIPPQHQANNPPTQKARKIRIPKQP